MGFWSPAIIVNDAQRHHILIYPVDVNRSQYRCTLEDKGIRLGFNYVRDFGKKQVITLFRCETKLHLLN
jgi:error-prone DNA polymerase